jgi:hypothetical protein
MFSSLCFAVDYYAEYSFAESEEIDYRELNDYDFVFHYTKADIQKQIDDDKKNYNPNHRRWKLADYKSRMFSASSDKRIFIIDLSVEYGPYGWLFIKINENEYVVFFTGA